MAAYTDVTIEHRLPIGGWWLVSGTITSGLAAGGHIPGATLGLAYILHPVSARGVGAADVDVECSMDFNWDGTAVLNGAVYIVPGADGVVKFTVIGR